MRRSSKTTQIGRREMDFILDASGPTLTVGSGDATVATGGAGDFTLTFTEPFARAPYAHVTGIVTDATGYSDASTVSTIDIKVETLAGVAADSDVFITVVGWDVADEI